MATNNPKTIAITMIVILGLIIILAIIFYKPVSTNQITTPDTVMPTNDQVMVKDTTPKTLPDTMETEVTTPETLPEAMVEDKQLPPEDTTETTLPPPEEEEPPATLQLSGTVLAGTTTTKLYDYNEADYKKALESDKLIVLYYYANWCPICREETKNALFPAFNDLNNSNVVGFRININDSDTDKSESALARQHGVVYQHTKVFIKNKEQILKSPQQWDKQKFFEEIDNAL